MKIDVLSSQTVRLNMLLINRNFLWVCWRELGMFLSRLYSELYDFKQQQRYITLR